LITAGVGDAIDAAELAPGRPLRFVA